MKLERVRGHPAQTSTSTLPPIPPSANSRSLHPLQTSSKPPTTSPQTLAQSLPANRSSHLPFSTQLILSSLAAAAVLRSATISLAALNLLAAREVACRVTWMLSQSAERVKRRSVVDE